MMKATAAVVIVLVLSAMRAVSEQHTESTSEDFRVLMVAVSSAWNQGSASSAVSCFTDDAVYMEPPDRRVYIGRKALIDFFGGTKRQEKPMQMLWHHLAFDTATQVGFGEYTFAQNHRYHGIVIVKLQDGKIKSWREYQYQSNLEWRDFTGKGSF